MRPITFLNGIIFACSSAITLAMGVMLLMRLVLLSDQSVNAQEVMGQLPAADLLRYAATLFVVAVCAGWAFFGQLFLRPWRWRAQAVQVAAVLAALAYLFTPADGRVQVLEGVALITGVIALGQFSGLLRRVWEWINAD